MRISQQGAVAFQFLALSFVVTIPYATFESYFGKGAWFLLFLLQGLITCHKGRLLFVGLALLVLVEGLKCALSPRRGLFWLAKEYRRLSIYVMDLAGWFNDGLARWSRNL